jgi:DeoR family transcriptional regulator, fructose operon transcriptional repressor
MYREERQYLIQVDLERHGTVSVTEQASRFGVSEVTIRKDLRYLSASGRIRRTHGGAIVQAVSERAAGWDLRADDEADEKEDIGRAAAGLIIPGETIILDSGTTTARIATNLGAVEHLDVVTLDPRVAAAASQWPNVRVSLTGGFTRGDLPLWGPDCVRNVLAHRGVDKAFLSSGGVSLEAGLSDEHLASHPCKRAILEAARETIVVAHASKFGRVVGEPFASLEQVRRIVTGKSLAGHILSALRDRGIEVILV